MPTAKRSIKPKENQHFCIADKRQDCTAFNCTLRTGTSEKKEPARSWSWTRFPDSARLVGSALRAPGVAPAPRLTLRPGQSGIRPPHARPDWEDLEALVAWQSCGIAELPVAGTPATRPRHVPEPPGGSGAWQKALAGARGSPWNCWD